jgi:hypothetical protein
MLGLRIAAATWSSNILIEKDPIMKNTVKASGAAIATAAALMFGTFAVTTAHAEDAKIKCEGVNSCKGTSACATAKNSCQGQNSCKGHGFLLLSKADCDAAKAKLEAEGKK